MTRRVTDFEARTCQRSWLLAWLLVCALTVPVIADEACAAGWIVRRLTAGASDWVEEQVTVRLLPGPEGRPCKGIRVRTVTATKDHRGSSRLHRSSTLIPLLLFRVEFQRA